MKLGERCNVLLSDHLISMPQIFSRVCIETFIGSDSDIRLSTIAWWMLDLWFGLDASGFDKASMWQVELSFASE
jgi:hypothetical protein